MSAKNDRLIGAWEITSITMLILMVIWTDAFMVLLLPWLITPLTQDLLRGTHGHVIPATAV